MKSFDEFVNEKFKYETSMINGKKVSSTFQGSTSNMNEFIKHVKDLPKTLKSIKIPTETLSFNPDQEEFKGPISSGDKNKIIKIIKDLTKQFKEKGDPVYEYSISSYYGVLSGSGETNDPIYISFRTKGHDRFGQAMSRGDYGPLD